jgi:DNA-binding transcriptional regulator YhcF (GntR family)
MPSVRELASQLAINPIRSKGLPGTEAKVISIHPRQGSFAGEHREVDETRKAELLKKLDDIVTELRFLGVGAPQLIERMKNEEHKEGKKP